MKSMRQLQNVTLLLLGIFCLVACSESDDKENSPVSIEQEGKGGSGYDNTTVVGTGSAEIT